LFQRGDASLRKRNTSFFPQDELFLAANKTFRPAFVSQELRFKQDIACHNPKSSRLDAFAAGNRAEHVHFLPFARDIGVFLNLLRSARTSSESQRIV
jgi:hypothetical protein